MPVLGPMSTVTNNNYEDDSMPRNTIHEVAPAPVYAVKYTDGYGKTQMRLVVILGEQPFLLDTAVSEKARATQKWFADQMKEKLDPPKRVRRKRAEKSAVEKKEENLKDTKPHRVSKKMKTLDVEAL